jgi:hypothetical protein
VVQVGEPTRSDRYGPVEPNERRGAKSEKWRAKGGERGANAKASTLGSEQRGGGVERGPGEEPDGRE